MGIGCSPRSTQRRYTISRRPADFFVEITQPAIGRRRLARGSRLSYTTRNGASCQDSAGRACVVMAVEFAVLASGSRGNASLVNSHGSGLLIDLGLGSRSLTRRLASVGASWEKLAAALLTHTHGDHVCDSTLRALLRHNIPLYCHEGQRDGLSRFPQFLALEKAGCVRQYDDRPFLTPDGMRVEPIVASHDAGPTYGFRVECRPGRKGPAVAIGYLSDTGCWRSHTADALVDVDVLGIEFNHDVEMQKNSGRAPVPDREEPRESRPSFQRSGRRIDLGRPGAVAREVRQARGLAPPEPGVQPPRPGPLGGKGGGAGKRAAVVGACGRAMDGVPASAASHRQADEPKAAP